MIKLAVFHNFLDNIGGAEMVALTVAKHFNAQVFTTNVDRDKIAKMGFAGVCVHSIGKVPDHAPFRQQYASQLFKKLHLKNFDLHLIGGDWAVSGALNHHPNVWYVHSPIREIWDLYQHTRREVVPWYGRRIFDAWVKYNRHYNRIYCGQVDRLVCNGKNTQKRIKKYFNIEAQVIYPPIETQKLSWAPHQNYWLSVNRLVAHKNLEVLIEAFKKLPRHRLILVGSYEKAAHFKRYAQKIERILPANVSLMSWVSRAQLIKLYSECTGHISCAFDEDFGMSTVEALASGKPVIVSNRGGFRETVIDGQNGVRIDSISAQTIINAVLSIENKSDSFRNNCQRQAQNFSEHNFLAKMENVFEHTLSS